MNTSRITHSIRLFLILTFLGAYATDRALPLPFAATPTASAQTVCGGVYSAVADTTIDQTSDSTNYGTRQELRVGNDGIGAVATLLRFDLNNVPAAATILQADLELTPAEPSNTGDLPLDVRAIADAWDEELVTWQTQPTLGARYGERAVDAAQVTVRIDVTALVTAWMQQGETPHGLALVAERGFATFASRETSLGLNMEPRLVVRCAPMEETGGVDPTDADARQQAGLDALAPDALTLNNGAISAAALDVPIPAAYTTSETRARWFLDTYRDALRLNDPATQLQFVKRTVAPDNTSEAVRFRQHIDDVPVVGAALTVQIGGDRVRAISGRYLPDAAVPTTPRLAATDAEAIAGAVFGDGSVQLGERPARIDGNTVRPGIVGDTQLRYFNPALLDAGEQRTYLVWRVNVVGADDLVALYVDAVNGAIRFRETTALEGIDLDIQTANNDTSTSCWLLTNSDDPWFDEDGVVDGANPDADGRAAFAQANAVYDYWERRFDYDSYDDDGEDVEAYVHVGVNSGNAAYKTSCDLFEFGDGMVANDVFAHEFTHAVIRNASDLVYTNQSGALNESLADIFGFFMDPMDWTIGEDGMNGALRSMSNPPQFSHPDRMSRFVVTRADNGGVHINSGIHNKAAFLLINGGMFNGFTVSSIGIPKAEQLYFNLITMRLWPSAGLHDARDAAVAEAQWQRALGRFTASDVCQVQNAYAAVELGPPDRNCDGLPDNALVDADNDRVWDDRDNCPGVSNAGQNDTDDDDIGDACDPDIDNDDVANADDNCRYVANNAQKDWNQDNVGDACSDADGDGVRDDIDNCRTTASRDQDNHDSDTSGDACDEDDDNDFVPDTIDNCRITFNPDQEDADMDNVGDACDRCPGLATSDNTDSDNDGRANPCDADDDNDAIPDADDACPLEAGLGCLGIERFFRQDIPLGRLHRLPIPTCDCPDGVFAPGIERVVNINIPVGFRAHIVDSAGMTVAKANALDGGLVTLHFRPLLGGARRAGLAGAALLADADDVRYYLDIMPAAGVDPDQLQPVAIEVEQRHPRRTFLPSISNGLPEEME